MGVQHESGFTLIELITIMILVGILAVTAMPRFFDNTFSERGFHDGVKATVQQARRVAVASRRYVCVTVTPGVGAAGIVSISMDTALPELDTTPVNCATAVALPASVAGCAANQLCAPRGVTLGGNSAVFDPQGRPVVLATKAAQAAALTITVTNQPNVTIQPETGLVQ